MEIALRRRQLDGCFLSCGCPEIIRCKPAMERCCCLPSVCLCRAHRLAGTKKGNRQVEGKHIPTTNHILSNRGAHLKKISPRNWNKRLEQDVPRYTQSLRHSNSKFHQSCFRHHCTATVTKYRSACAHRHDIKSLGKACSRYRAAPLPAQIGVMMCAATGRLPEKV